MAALDLDAGGFLRAVDALGRRFEKAVVSGVSGESRTEGRRGCDHALYAAASDVFGCTGWAAAIGAAPCMPDPDAVRACRRFLDGSSAVVERYGMAVWLYDLLNDAAFAVVIGEPSDRMPWRVTGGCASPSNPAGCDDGDDADGGLVDDGRVRRDCADDGGGGGDRGDVVRTERGRMAAADSCGCRSRDGVRGRHRARGRDDSDIMEHAVQMHRLAAYSVLRWGGRESRGLDIARMLLDNPGLGMGMLREDDGVRALGATRDMRYRRAVDYLKELHAQADLQYAEFLARDGGPRPSSARPPGFGAVDARYLYDARRLVPAYRALWDEQVIPGNEMLERVEYIDGRPDVPLWRNTAYLDDLAKSLMGVSFAADLVMGFEERDEERFREGAERLDEFADFVEAVGFVALPGIVLGTYATDCEDLAAMPPCERERERRLLGRVGDSMASMVLARMPCDRTARRAAMAMIACDTARYMALVMDMLDGMPEEVC